MTQLIALRSFGDFVVLMHAIKQSQSNRKINIIVSKHLKPLWEALSLTSANTNIEFEFVDFGIKKGLLSFFTNKFLISKTCILELMALRNFLKNCKFLADNDIYIERGNRKNILQLILRMKLKTVHKAGNVYNSAQQFFKANNSTVINNSFPTDKILVFPDSRKKKKVIPESILLTLNTFCNSNKTELTTAFFGSSSVSKKDTVFYKDFETLVKLIKEAHFIISSDSVTAHLAQYFNKPHFILYPDKVNFEWLTPWAAKTNMYTTFDEAHVLFNKIDKA